MAFITSSFVHKSDVRSSDNFILDNAYSVVLHLYNVKNVTSCDHHIYFQSLTNN